jgi:hypothetical protein
MHVASASTSTLRQHNCMSGISISNKEYNADDKVIGIMWWTVTPCRIARHQNAGYLHMHSINTGSTYASSRHWSRLNGSAWAVWWEFIMVFTTFRRKVVILLCYKLDYFWERPFWFCGAIVHALMLHCSGFRLWLPLFGGWYLHRTAGLESVNFTRGNGWHWTSLWFGIRLNFFS